MAHEALHPSHEQWAGRAGLTEAKGVRVRQSKRYEQHGKRPRRRKKS